MEKLNENTVLQDIFSNAGIRNTENRVGEMWHRSVANGLDEMEVDALPVAGIPQLVDVFRRAGIKTFVVTDKSDHLIAKLHLLEKCGCRMTGLCRIKHPIPGSNKTLFVRGIRFQIQDTSGGKQA